MIKKIVFFISMLIASVGCFSQEYLYITPSFNNKFDFGLDSRVYDITIDIQLYREISESTFTRFSYGIGARFISGVFGPIFEISYGVGKKFNNFYGLVDFTPTIKCVGKDHQVNGDEMAFGFIPKIGVGYNIPLSESMFIFVEVGGFKEFEIIYSRDDLNVNSYGVYVNVGFKFKQGD